MTEPERAEALALARTAMKLPYSVNGYTGEYTRTLAAALLAAEEELARIKAADILTCETCHQGFEPRDDRRPDADGICHECRKATP